MDPFTIVTGVISILAGADLVIKASKCIYRSGQMMKGANNEISKFARAIQLYGNLVESAFTTLERLKDLPPNENTPALKLMLNREVLAGIAAQCNSIEKDVVKYTYVVRDLRFKGAMKVAFKWGFHQKEVEILGKEMESVKNNLNLILNILKIESYLEGPQTKAVLKEIKRLQRENRIHITTIAELQDKLETARKPHNRGETEIAVASHNRIALDALQKLDDNLARKRRVPGYPRPQTSSTFSSPSAESQVRRSSTINTSVSSFPTSERNRSNKSLPLIVAPLRTLRHAKHRGPFPVAREAEETAPVLKMTENNSERHPPPAETIIIPPAEPDVLGVQSTSKLIRLDLDVGYQGETVYVHTPTGRLHIGDARLYKDLSVNLISQNFVTAHKFKRTTLFDMDNLAKEDELWVQIGNGIKERCVGRVQFLWNTDVGSGVPGFPIDCWICVHGVDVMLGRPYAEKKKQVLFSKRGERG